MVEPNPDTELVALDQELHRIRRRARRLQHGMAQSTAQWAAWSSTMDEALNLVDQIAAIPAHGLAGIAVKIGALRWFLDGTEAVLDVKGLRQLRRLDRAAQRLTSR